MIIENFQGENVHQLGDAIREGMRVFTEGAAQSDDITILCIEYKGNPHDPEGHAANAGHAAQEGLPLETLEQVVATLNPETDPGELAAQMVCVLAAPGRFEGARLWRVVNGTPVVWQESGELAPADASRSNEFCTGKSNANGDGTTWVLGRGPNPVGVLETQPKGKLDATTRGWMDLFRRYAEVALESSERRHAVIELSTIVEATKRLNSTLDLAELLNIILQLTTRHTGAERGTVFLVDHDAQGNLVTGRVRVGTA